MIIETNESLKEYDFIIDPIFEPYINKDKAFNILFYNPKNAIHFILRNSDKIKINWSYLSRNPCPEVIQLLCTNFDKVDWCELSENTSPKAIQLLKENPDKINWFKLSCNPCPEAIQLLRENPDKISWWCLSMNPCPEALKLLRENVDKIDWGWLSLNPGIWMDTYKVAQREYFRKTIAEELMAMVWHPKNISRFEELGIEK